MEEMRAILVDEASELFDRTGMFYKKFPSDFRQIRYFTLLILQKAPPEMKEINLLEQQISELIKNAVKHGNRKDPGKSVHVWFAFDESCRTRGRASGDWRNGTSSTGGGMTASGARISRRWRSSSPTSPRTVMIMTAETPSSPPWSTGTRGWSSMRRRTAWPPRSASPTRGMGLPWRPEEAA